MFCLSAFSSFAKDDRPNIILFLADDQTRISTGVYGNKQVKTPNMDKLATNGAIFANNYATTTICMASRACILTGMYEYKTGCNFDKGDLYRSKFEKSYPVILRENGYFTGIAGKVGLDIKDDIDNKKLVGDDSLGANYFDWFAGGSGQTQYETSKNKHIAKYAKEYPHSTRAYGAAMKDFIAQALESGKPFCLSMSFKAPHTPMIPDPFFNDVYKDTIWERPANAGWENAKHLSLQARLGRQYLDYSRAYFKENAFQQTSRLYHQLIHGVDYAIGMVLDELEKQGIADNTIIMITSDNGYSCSAHGFGGKVLPYEEATKTPLIIYDPRAEKADTIWRNAVTANIDIAPTILDYAGVAIPENMDGKSLRNVVVKPEERVRKELALYQLWGSLPTVAMSIVTEDFKYIYYPYAEKIEAGEELYDLRNDRLETENLINNPEYKSTLDDMKAFYAVHFKKYQDENVKRDSYESFATIFNQDLDWGEKKKVVHKIFITGAHSYPNLLKRIKYTGDILDYDAVINHAIKRLSGENSTEATSKKSKKSKKEK